ncbi:response regulator [Azospirillum sp.]|uniref:response regulator n=1 Tax=Azospirillum sp. TaxID=34012 RepID=UPI002D6962BA|nr:response regulator [Azospirillum sp.]HYD65618.1 response regulator [Azospirillum sp.]
MDDDGGPRVHILIAEDEALAAMALQDVLERAGFRVTLSHDGQAALADAQADPPDALLTDLKMPRLGGLGLIQRLRASRLDLPVVIMSGDPPADWAEQVVDDGLGRTVLLVKPVSPLEVVKAIQAVLAV